MTKQGDDKNATKGKLRLKKATLKNLSPQKGKAAALKGGAGGTHINSCTCKCGP